MVKPVKPSHAALIFALLTTSCDPAAQVNGRGAAAPAAQSDDSRRQALRGCVKVCDRSHERESAAHISCVRRCLGIDERLRDDGPQAAEPEGELSAPWAIVFAMGVSSALAVLALLF
jgi:hypothetical protein